MQGRLARTQHVHIWCQEEGKISVFAYLLVLFELDVHIPCHLRELSRPIALPEEVTVTDLQCQHSH